MPLIERQIAVGWGRNESNPDAEYLPGRLVVSTAA